jgi:response regulator RpfG family c-di-GMP phosphodiesterase
MTGKKELVLIVDNDEDWLALLERLLAAEGLGVLKARGCGEAMRLAGERRPRCVITDYGLGEESGIELCCYLKASPLTRNVPVILLSGAEPPPSTCGCRWDAYVCKADGTGALVSVVKKLLCLDNVI